MIIVMKKDATVRQIANVTARVEQMGWQSIISEGEERTIIGVIGNGRPLDREQIERMDGVERTVPILRPFKLASREFHPQDTVVSHQRRSTVGGRKLVVMAGPCAVESREQLLETAQRRQGSRRTRAARRRLQAAHLSLQLSGPGRGRAASCWPRRARRPACRSSPR